MTSHSTSPGERSGFDGAPRSTAQRTRSRNRRALRLGAWVIVPSMIYWYVVVPYRARLAALESAIRAARTQLAAEVSLIAEGPDIAGALTRTDSLVVAGEAFLYRGAARAIIENEISADLQRIASASRVELRDVASPGADTASATVFAVRMRVRGATDLEGLITFVNRLETYPLHIRVAGISIRPERDWTLPETRADSPPQRIVHEPADPDDGELEFEILLDAWAVQISVNAPSPSLVRLDPARTAGGAAPKGMEQEQGMEQE